MTNIMQKVIYALLYLLVSQLAQAKLEIQIIQGNAAALPIAVIPMQWRASDPRPETGVAEVVSLDLHRSGLFDPLSDQDMVDRPVDAESIRFGTWRLLKVDYVVKNRVFIERFVPEFFVVVGSNVPPGIWVSFMILPS